MIKVFISSDYSEKVNYIDHNNRYAGMDSYQECCEDVGHDIYDQNGNTVEPDRQERDANGQEVLIYDNLEFKNEPPQEIYDAEYEEGGKVRFKLIDPTSGGEYTLEFHNYHNGYYSHTVEYGENEKDHPKTITL